MSNAFTNFLGGVSDGIFGNSANLKDYQHADRMYVRNTYARSPKVGFLYFISFNINQNAITDKTWLNRQGPRDVGMLVKRIDMPKFKITTETLNQYNRKTVVQTKLNYDPISIDFHDDNSDITTNLWKNYYQYYFADSKYGSIGSGKFKKGEIPVEFDDTKYGRVDNAYGLDNFQSKPFFDTIDIYILHQGKFSKITLINPKVTSWEHDNLDQSDGAKILASKMSVAYENVIYHPPGRIVKNSTPEGFAAVYYDTTPSPLGIGGNGTNTLFGAGGVIAGVSSIFGEDGSLANAKSPLDFLGVAIQANNLAKNARQISKSSLKNEGLSILNGVLGEVQASGNKNQPGSISEAIKNGANQSGLGVLGNIGVKLFSDKNSSVNDTTTAKPSKLTGGP